jgi:hypothetical protein
MLLMLILPLPLLPLLLLLLLLLLPLLPLPPLLLLERRKLAASTVIPCSMPARHAQPDSADAADDDEDEDDDDDGNDDDSASAFALITLRSSSVAFLACRSPPSRECATACVSSRCCRVAGAFASSGAEAAADVDDDEADDDADDDDDDGNARCASTPLPAVARAVL